MKAPPIPAEALKPRTVVKNFSLPVEENLDPPQSLNDNGKRPIANHQVLSSELELY